MVEVRPLDRTGSTYYGSFGSGVSWKAVAAGAIASLSSSLILLSLCAGLGLSLVSPYPGQGVNVSAMSAGSISLMSGLVLVVISAIASGIGGYVAGRLGSRWSNVHVDEVYFRDTAHGFVAWGLSTLLAVVFLGSVVSSIVGGAASGAAMGGTAAAAGNVNRNDVSNLTDKLFRQTAVQTTTTEATSPVTTTAQGASAMGQTSSTMDNAEYARLLAAPVSTGTDLSAEDRTYLVTTVSRRTGLSQQEADQRVTQVITDGRNAAEAARKAAAHSALWAALAMLVGAFVSSLMSTQGAIWRDKYPYTV